MHCSRCSVKLFSNSAAVRMIWKSEAGRVGLARKAAKNEEDQSDENQSPSRPQYPKDRQRREREREKGRERKKFELTRDNSLKIFCFLGPPFPIPVQAFQTSREGTVMVRGRAFIYYSTSKSQRHNGLVEGTKGREGTSGM